MNYPLALLITAVLLTLIVGIVSLLAPDGYEDEHGFHYGSEGDL